MTEADLNAGKGVIEKLCVYGVISKEEGIRQANELDKKYEEANSK